jgi:hypothetical protein
MITEYIDIGYYQAETALELPQLITIIQAINPLGIKRPRREVIVGP